MSVLESGADESPISFSSFLSLFKVILSSLPRRISWRQSNTITLRKKFVDLVVDFCHDLYVSLHGIETLL